MFRGWRCGMTTIGVVRSQRIKGLETTGCIHTFLLTCLLLHQNFLYSPTDAHTSKFQIKILKLLRYNNIYLLQSCCHPLAVVILHVYKI